MKTAVLELEATERTTNVNYRDRESKHALYSFACVALMLVLEPDERKDVLSA